MFWALAQFAADLAARLARGQSPREGTGGSELLVDRFGLVWFSYARTPDPLVLTVHDQEQASNCGMLDSRLRSGRALSLNKPLWVGLSGIKRGLRVIDEANAKARFFVSPFPQMPTSPRLDFSEALNPDPTLNSQL